MAASEFVIYVEKERMTQDGQLFAFLQRLNVTLNSLTTLTKIWLTLCEGTKNTET